MDEISFENCDAFYSWEQMSKLAFTFVTSLRCNPRDEDLQLDCLEALCQITNEVLHLSNIEDAVEYFGKCFWLKEISTAMENFPDNVEVQQTACRCLSVLLKQCPELCEFIGDNERGKFPFSQYIITALRGHYNSSAMFQNACEVISVMSNSCEIIQQEFIQNDIQELILRKMVDSEEMNEQKAGVIALIRLSCDQIEFKKRLLKDDILTCLMNIFENFPNVPEIQEQAIILLARLASDLEVVRQQCIVEEIPVILLGILKLSSHEESLVKVTLEALGVLCASDGVPDILRKSDGIMLTVAVMKDHYMNLAIQKKGIVLLQLLVTNHVLKVNTFVASVNVIKSAMETFPFDVDIQTETCVIIHVLAENNRKQSIDLVNLNIHEQFFKIFENFPDDEELLDVASECVYLLACTQDLKNLMLLSMCGVGFLKAAECLIQLGADVNYGDDKNTPLCLACRANNLELVNYLLSQGVADVHSALALCLDLERHNITGFLLKHMGHDEEAGTITLSGLNLGSPQPDWLVPAMLGNAVYLSRFSSSQWWDLVERARHSRLLKRRLSTSFCSTVGSDQESIRESNRLSQYITLQEDSIMVTPYPDHMTSSDSLTVPIQQNSLSDQSDSISSLNSSDRYRLTNLPSARLRSVSGVSIPYSSSDPRVIIPNEPRKDIILPDSQLLSDASLLEDVFEKPVRSISDEIWIQKRRSVTDLGIAIPMGISRFFTTETEPISKSYAPSTSKKGMKKSISGSVLQNRASSPTGPLSQNPVHRLDLSCNEILDVDILARRSGILSIHLKSIENLDLSNNKLDSLPKDLCKTMPRITHLVLKHNNFREIPGCILTSSNLEWLDLSHNFISTISKPRSPLSSFVLHLNLSHNKIKVFPVWLGDAFQLLTFLDLSYNLLSQLKNITINVKKLKSLDLSNNTIQSIPAEFMSQLKDLETFKASHNQLKSLPDSVAPLLVKLVTVKLSHNRLIEKAPFYITKFVLLLPNVHIVDLSENGLQCVASPLAWASQSLKDLDVSKNKLSHLDLTKGVSKWMFLTRLDLSNNQLKQVPKGIGQLKSLGQLNLSGNSRITTLPDEMGNLGRLWEFLHTQMKLDMNASILRGRTRDLVGHLHAKLRNSAPFPQRKLVMCGPRGEGKSSLLRLLVSSKVLKKVRVEKRKMRGTSSCLEVQKWMVQDVKADCKCCSRKNVTLILRVWEFNGLDSSVCVHRCFLTESDLHVLVYDVSAKLEEMEKLKPWLANIYDQCPSSGVILVGTHFDKIPAAQQKSHLRQVSEYVKKIHTTLGLPEIRGHFVVSCLKNDQRVDELARRLLNQAMACNTKGYEIQNHRVPRSFISLQETVESKLNTLDDNVGVFGIGFLMKIVQEKKLDINNEELNEAILFLRQSGLLVNYANPTDKLNEIFFLWPTRLATLIAYVVHYFSTTKDMSLIELHDVSKIIVKQGFPKSYLPQILRLFEIFEIILPVTQSMYFGTSSLSLERPKPLMSTSVTSPGILCRRYTMPYFPLGFWFRLVIHLLVHNKEMIDVQQQISTGEIKNIMCQYWRRGFSGYWDDECNFLIEIRDNVLNINVPSNQYGHILLGNLVYHIDTLIREWYPVLCGVDSLYGYPMIRKTTFCVSCQEHQFPIEDCAHQARSQSFIECPLDNAVNTLKDQAPDVLLSHIDQRYLIKEHELNYEERPDSLLGEGAFGSVYRGKYKDKMVAAKIFKAQLECESGLEYLEQEVRFLSRLRHPSIIDFIGMSLRPCAIAVLEIAPLGSLNAIFRRQQTLSRGIQHRIAMQVAEGLAFLHSRTIVYRDLKPHNILIFSLAAGTLVNAKISDFGSSRHAMPFGFIAAEGTPGYRAPEVARRDVVYNEKADIFSLGMLFYELATGGKQPFSNLKFRSELDEAVINGRPVEPIIMADSPAWPDMQDLLDNILVPQPECRPTADQVYERLSGPEFISLKNDIAVCKGQAVECMTVRCYNEERHSKLEVWVGSGASDWSDFKEKKSGESESVHTSQLSRFDLSSSKPKGCKGTILQDGRIMAIIAIGEHMILVGTQTGNLWVYDTAQEKFLYPMAKLPDALLCLHHNCIDQYDLVFAGLASGDLVVYNTWEFNNPPTTTRIINIGTDVCCNGVPMLCMAVTKKRLFCALGHNIVALKLGQPDIFPEYSWSVNGSSDSHKGVVSNIVVDKQGIWSSTKGSSRIQLWDPRTRELCGQFNCEDLLAFELSSRELRVVSLLIHNNILWVGTGGGQILLVDTNTMALLMTMCRHKFAVRCLTTAVLKEGGKPISTVLSGGLGFIPRQSSSCTSSSNDFGYVLVWDSGIHEESKELQEYKMKRNEWFNNHANR